MLRRPWFIVILAVLHIFTPLVNILIQSSIFGVTPIEFVKNFRDVGILEIYRIYFLLPVAGIAIFAMKRWSYPVFFGSWIWCMVGNYQSLMESISSPGKATPYPVGWQAFSMALNLVLIAYFVLPRVRAAYFLPNIRWWEHRPRYLLKGIAVTARSDNHVYTGELENISSTGTKVKLAPSSFAALTSGEWVQLTFELFSEKYRVNGQIVRAEPNGAFGIQLLHSAKSRSEFKLLLKQLKSAHANKKSETVSLSDDFQDFLKWLKSLKKDRGALLPRINTLNDRDPS